MVRLQSSIPATVSKSRSFHPVRQAALDEAPVTLEDPGALRPRVRDEPESARLGDGVGDLCLG